MTESENTGSANNIILSTAYFPPLIYFACMLSGRHIVIEKHETFRKQTFRNRCEILAVTGKASLVVPVSKPHGNHTRTEDIVISYREPWQRHHWRTLKAAYNSSPYFQYYSEQIEPLFKGEENLLLDLNYRILNSINELLETGTEISFSENFEKEYASSLDMRENISPKKPVEWSSHANYPQVFSHIHGFIPGLSILDLLFNMGPDSKNYLRELWSACLTGGILQLGGLYS